MASKPKNPMPIAERAKQFLPFAAVKGLNEALEKKEKVMAKRIDMTDERALMLDETLRDMKQGDWIEVTYYERDRYVIASGQVSGVDAIYKKLRIGDQSISFEDILEVNSRY